VRRRAFVAALFLVAAIALEAGRVTAQPIPPVPEPGPGPGADPCAAPPPPQPGPTTLSTPPQVTVEPGQTATFTAVADIAPRPTPVDVFFVIDSSNSMGPVFDSLKLSIHKASADLASSGIAVQVGVADFSDLQVRPYRRLLALEPVDCDIVRALATVTTTGGAEPHRLALEQAVTGSGRREVRVPRGQSAGFRPGTLRLVVHATDERIDGRLPYSPSHEALVEMFRRERVLHVGLTVAQVTGVSGDIGAFDDPDRVGRDLDALARDTGAVAPANGLDCDGDGAMDLKPGAPVNCKFGIGVTTGTGAVGQASVGQLVTQIVRALRSTTPVSLVASSDGPLGSCRRPPNVRSTSRSRGERRMTSRCGAVLRRSARRSRFGQWCGWPVRPRQRRSPG
jgi:hypothetical protein